MVVEDALGAGSELINNFPTDISGLLAKLITILQVVGIAVIVYVIYLIIRGISNWRRNKRIDKTYNLVIEINNKLDAFIGDKKKEKLKELEKVEREIEKEKKELKENKKEKKKGFFSRLFGKDKSEKKGKR